MFNPDPFFVPYPVVHFVKELKARGWTLETFSC